MKTNRFLLLVAIRLLLATGVWLLVKRDTTDDSSFVFYIADPKERAVKLYWKDDRNENFKSIANLRSWLGKKHQQLVFAMNAGMYKSNYFPVGLFIEDGKMISPLDTINGEGNFYLKPNGVFYITTDHLAGICTSAQGKDHGKIKYATQSGPMLVIDGNIHPAFKKGSANRNIRNGVGILPDNKVLFAMSKKEINFYDFAAYFKNKGCKNALYLDGLVSRTYLPEKNWIQTDGDFGVIIGITSKAD